MSMLRISAILLAVVPAFTGSAHAQCADPPTSPRGRCVKANGGTCDARTKIWVSPNEAVKRQCARLSPAADRKGR
jgi:hypothetical protein